MPEPALVLPSCDLESQLRIVCEKYSGPHAQIATELLDSLLPGSSGSIPAHHASTSSQGRLDDIVNRGLGVRRKESSLEIVRNLHKTRDRSSSAPNINIVRDELSFEQMRTLQASSMHSGLFTLNLAFFTSIALEKYIVMVDCGGFTAFWLGLYQYDDELFDLINPTVEVSYWNAPNPDDFAVTGQPVEVVKFYLSFVDE
uniref:Uncharacterized protein n=2 Tax=Meloidogyne incognita TaxID=6306 RepID=A0A914L815_MELIC